MTDLPTTYLLAVESHDGLMIVEVEKEKWKKLSPTLMWSRHVIDMSVLFVKRQSWVSDVHLEGWVKKWAVANLDVAF